jgi:hypothetical protein
LLTRVIVGASVDGITDSQGGTASRSHGHELTQSHKRSPGTDQPTTTWHPAVPPGVHTLYMGHTVQRGHYRVAEDCARFGGNLGGIAHVTGWCSFWHHQKGSGVGGWEVWHVGSQQSAEHEVLTSSPPMRFHPRHDSTLPSAHCPKLVRESFKSLNPNKGLGVESGPRLPRGNATARNHPR